MVVLIPAQWGIFTVTVIDCYVLKFFYDSLSWMTETTHYYHMFHWKYYVGWSYFNFIDMMINDSIWSTLPSDLTLLLLFFITNYPTMNFFQVINYNLIDYKLTICQMLVHFQSSWLSYNLSLEKIPGWIISNKE